jgi:hypothetical protein
VALAKLAPHHLVAPPALFSPSRDELGFHYMAVERALLVEQGRRSRAEAVRAVVAARPVSQPIIRSALFSVLSDVGPPSSLDVQHEVSVSLGIVGHNGWGTHDKTLP